MLSGRVLGPLRKQALGRAKWHSLPSTTSPLWGLLNRRKGFSFQDVYERAPVSSHLRKEGSSPKRVIFFLKKFLLAIQKPNGSALDNQAVEDTSRDAGSPKLKQNVVVLDPADYTGHCSFLRGLFAVPNSWTEITADFLEDAFRKVLTEMDYLATQKPNGSALDNQAVEDTSRDAGSPKLKQNVVVLDPADYTGHCSFLRGLFAVPNSWTEITADFLEDAFRKVLTEMDYLGSYTSLAIQDYLAHYLSRHRGELNGTRDHPQPVPSWGS
ncbi:uncharacterized protein LOC129346032 [Eublepharis macularius]|uniref:Uncharacterized protein LOC129346032 n=1 Tax=Eublepharis macularius TaxID=481883 RepID=A0AA97KPY5_EUBMA|nr:uncharacterized protein LOC129346032 [Eublepharis macularius]